MNRYAPLLIGGVLLWGWVSRNLILAVPAAIVLWAARAYFWPMAPCGKCQGVKTNRGSTKRRFGSCRRCGGSGIRQVTGSKQVHGAVLALKVYRKRDD